MSAWSELALVDMGFLLIVVAVVGLVFGPWEALAVFGAGLLVEGWGER